MGFPKPSFINNNDYDNYANSNNNNKLIMVPTLKSLMVLSMVAGRRMPEQPSHSRVLPLPHHHTVL